MKPIHFDTRIHLCMHPVPRLDAPAPVSTPFPCPDGPGMYGKLRASGVKADLALVVADEPAVAAGAFTTNMMCAAPVTFCKEVRRLPRRLITSIGR